MSLKQNEVELCDVIFNVLTKFTTIFSEGLVRGDATTADLYLMEATIK